MRLWKSRSFLWFCVLSLAVRSLYGQLSSNFVSSGASDYTSSSVIRVNTSLVTVPVSVTDANGKPVLDLKMDEFRIEEDGRFQEVQKMAEAGQSTLQIALLFDLSGSLSPRFEFEQKAAIRFLEKIMKPGDTVSIVTFTEDQQILLRNSPSLKDALQQLLMLKPTESATAFYDSVVYTAKLLQQMATPETRRAQIVLSDGEDNRSDRTIFDALKEVQRCDTIFYSINPGGASIRLNEISIKGQRDLHSLASQTGGTAFISDDRSDLDGIFSLIATELRAQYLLSYYSSNSALDDQFRRIAVSIPGRPDLRVRARQGYFAARR